MKGLTDYEQQTLNEFRRDDDRARMIIERVCEVKGNESREACARQMAHVPREVDLAANYAAHAEVYDRFMRELFEE